MRGAGDGRLLDEHLMGPRSVPSAEGGNFRSFWGHQNFRLTFVNSGGSPALKALEAS